MKRRRKGHRAETTAWAQRTPRFLPVGQRDSGRRKGALSRPDTEWAPGMPRDLLPKGLEDPACPRREWQASQALPVKALSRITRLPRYTFRP